MKDLGGEITAEDTPCRAVEGEADDMLITGKDFINRKCLRAIRKDSPILN